MDYEGAIKVIRYTLKEINRVNDGGYYGVEIDTDLVGDLEELKKWLRIKSKEEKISNIVKVR